MEERVIQNVEALQSFAKEFLTALPVREGATVVALSGDLGAGKTTFTQALARVLDVSEVVTSPTFVVMKHYRTHDERFSHLVHIDAYRIEDIREIEVLHIPELFTQSHTLICIEWPERIDAILPKERISVSLARNDDGTHTITYGS